MCCLRKQGICTWHEKSLSIKEKMKNIVTRSVRTQVSNNTMSHVILRLDHCGQLIFPRCSCLAYLEADSFQFGNLETGLNETGKPKFS